MKIEFDVTNPEEVSAIKQCLKAGEYKSVLIEIYQKSRSFLKYSDTDNAQEACATLEEIKIMAGDYIGEE